MIKTLPHRALALCLLLCALCITACASVMPRIEAPKVSVESLTPVGVGRQGMPRFAVKLRVQNPNSIALDVAGIAYSIDLLGRELISGVSREVPRIEPYTEEVVTLEAGINLIQVFKLFGSVDRLYSGVLDYRFAAKVDFNGPVPTQYVEDSGELRLLGN